MKAHAPGKLILTGEHAVVHGAPALVTAISRFATCEVSLEKDPAVVLQLDDFEDVLRTDYESLAATRSTLSERHEQFTQGKMPVSDILRNESELVTFALALIVAAYGHPEKGLQLRLHSDIPIGCGMGSSAASILSVMRATSAVLGMDVPPTQMLELALEAEKLQHGNPSGVDPYICLHGGCCRFQSGHAQPIDLPTIPLHLVHTGVPESTTGECVAHATPHFESADMIQAFRDVETEMESAFLSHDLAKVTSLVQRNHRLLTGIGVVPTQVQAFIEALEAEGHAAKICGAGSIKGPGAGMVWVVAEESPVAICREFDYTMVSAQGEPRGTSIV